MSGVAESSSGIPTATGRSDSSDNITDRRNGFEDESLEEMETWDLCRMSEEVLPHCVDAIQLILYQQELKLSQTREIIHDNLAQQTSQLRLMVDNAHKNYSSGHGKLHEEYIKAGLILPLKPQNITSNTSNKFPPHLTGTIRSGKTEEQNEDEADGEEEEGRRGRSRRRTSRRSRRIPKQTMR